MSCRLRIKIPSKKGDAPYFVTLREKLSDCPGVEAVSVSPQTGSALILHDCETKAIFAYAKRNELFVRKRRTRERKTIFDSVADTFQAYNRDLKKWTGGEVDIASLVFLSLIASGIYQIAKGNLVMPAWYTAFYYALGVFTRAKVDEWDEGEDLLDESDDADGD
jgi:hypothetical protein